MPAAPKLPASIKVGHRDIAIELTPASELDGAYGDYSTDKQLIRISCDLKPQSMAGTVIHELLHACWPNHWSLVGDVQETIVSALEPALSQVWRDNPELFAWLSHNLS
jgi:hypothetical protein